jgi:DNA-binding NarL/FixJ family response regulator
MNTATNGTNECSKPLNGTTVHGKLRKKASGEILVIRESGVVYRSHDQGQNWQRVAATIRSDAQGGIHVRFDGVNPERVSKTERTPTRPLAEGGETTPVPIDYGLSPRELEILRLLAEGMLKKEIADCLGITKNTVSTHLRRVYGKLFVNTNTGAVSKALREGIL